MKINCITRRRFVKTACTSIVAVSIPTPAVIAGDAARKDNLKRLVDWVVASLVAGPVNLVPNLPTGQTYGKSDRSDLKDLFWLQNCNLFAYHALEHFQPQAAETIKKSYEKWYHTAFANIIEQTENYLSLAKLPADTPPEGKYFRTIVKKHTRDGMTIGTETYQPDFLGTIKDDDPRALLKFGVFGARLRGDQKKAEQYFKKALSLWDGTGFQNTRIDRHNAYYTRHLAYVLIAEKALHTKIPPKTKAQIQNQLWSLQDKDGGIWTNYYKDGTLPHFAKKTNEIAPLTLLAHTNHIWK